SVSARRVMMHLPSVACYSLSSSFCRIVVVDTVLIAAQHRQVCWCGVAAGFVCFDVVYLAPIGGHGAVWPWADKVFCRRHNALLQRRKPRFIQVDGSGGGVEQSGIQLLTQCAG